MKKVRVSLVAALAALGLVAGMISPASAAPLKGEGENLEIVANIDYAGGTDMEFTTIKGRDYAFTGSAPGVGGEEVGGLHVIDITTPNKPKEVAYLGCGLYQADIQISADNKYVYMAADSAGVARRRARVSARKASSSSTSRIRRSRSRSPSPRRARRTT